MVYAPVGCLLRQKHNVDENFQVMNDLTLVMAMVMDYDERTVRLGLSLVQVH